MNGPELTIMFTGVMAICAVVTLVSAGLAAYVNLRTAAVLKDYATKAELQECRAIHGLHARKANA
jgi:Na+-translocating ferredoxin:NAD+ oxidoreductase RnfG subunit